MSQEAVEAKLVNRTASILRMARHVIEKLHEDKEKGFQEEPSLSDLVLVAQIIGQNSMLDKMGEVGALPPGTEAPQQDLGEAVAVGIPLPDVVVFWSTHPNGWFVNVNPEFQQETTFCKTPEELLVALQNVAALCGMNRIPPNPKQP